MKLLKWIVTILNLIVEYEVLLSSDSMELV